MAGGDRASVFVSLFRATSLYFLFVTATLALTVHIAVTFLISTNMLQRKFFYYYQLDTQISRSFTQITLIKLLYMFRAHSAQHQEVHDANFTYAASGIVTLCKWLSCATVREGLVGWVKKHEFKWNKPRKVCIFLVLLTYVYHDARFIECKILLSYILYVQMLVLHIRNLASNLVNPVKTKRRLLYLKTHSVPRCKHFSSRL